MHAAFVSATAHSRPQPSATAARPRRGPYMAKPIWRVLQKCWSHLEVLNVVYVWQVWHFVTFQHVSYRVKNRSV